MQLDIEARDFELNDALRSQAEWRQRVALTRCGDRIQRVVMRLSDVDGLRGGAPDVVVEDVESDPYGARGVRNAEWEASGNIRVEIICDDATVDAIVAYLKARYSDD